MARVWWLCAGEAWDLENKAEAILSREEAEGTITDGFMEG
jgi:hypothetical protein